MILLHVLYVTTYTLVQRNAQACWSLIDRYSWLKKKTKQYKTCFKVLILFACDITAEASYKNNKHVICWKKKCSIVLLIAYNNVCQCSRSHFIIIIILWALQREYRVIRVARFDWFERKIQEKLIVKTSALRRRFRVFNYLFFRFSMRQ